jgi:Domain of unknown function (DUF4430)
MHRKNILAVCGATVAAVALLTGAASAAPGPAVTVRVEGVKRTLLAPTVVHIHAGSITKGGAPSGACPAKSAAGALDTATRHHWVGTWSSSFNDYEVTSILGEAHSFSTNLYWSVWINNKYATTGVCEIKLRRGDQVLFAAEGSKTEDPIAIEAPSSATVGHTFQVTVVSFSEAGKSRPLAGAAVSVAGHSGKTDSHGTVPLTPSSIGTFTINAAHTGYIRAAPVTVHVSG